MNVPLVVVAAFGAALYLLGAAGTAQWLVRNAPPPDEPGRATRRVVVARAVAVALLWPPVFVLAPLAARSPRLAAWLAGGPS